VKYVYLAASILIFLSGLYCGSKFLPRHEVRTVSVPVTTVKTQTVTKVIERFPDGKVVERYITQTIDKTKTSPQPKVPQYRAGVLIRPDHKPDLGDTKISASRRLMGSVWADAQYDLRHKEITLGLSYEF
jgi:hypothetical protein